MKRNVTFSERQWFRQIWIWLLLLAVNAFILYGFIQQVVMGKPFGTNPGSDLVITLTLLFMLLITGLILSMRLETYIDADGIQYRFFPVHFYNKRIAWSDVDKVYIRKYNAIVEYGGWGIRYGIFGKGNAYNMSGNMGLQLVFKNGKKLLFGTQRSDDLDRVIDQLGVKTADEVSADR